MSSQGCPNPVSGHRWGVGDRKDVVAPKGVVSVRVPVVLAGV